MMELSNWMGFGFDMCGLALDKDLITHAGLHQPPLSPGDQAGDVGMEKMQKDRNHLRLTSLSPATAFGERRKTGIAAYHRR